MRIFDKFIKYNADYPLYLNNNVRKKIGKILKQSFKLKKNGVKINKNVVVVRNETDLNIDINEDVIRISKGLLYRFGSVFDEAHKDVFLIMKMRYFPKFLSNDLCEALLDRLKVEETFLDALKRSNMI